MACWADQALVAECCRALRARRAALARALSCRCDVKQLAPFRGRQSRCRRQLVGASAVSHQARRFRARSRLVGDARTSALTSKCRQAARVSRKVRRARHRRAPDRDTPTTRAALMHGCNDLTRIACAVERTTGRACDHALRWSAKNSARRLVGGRRVRVHLSEPRPTGARTALG